MPTNHAARLAAEISDLRRRLAALERGRQITHSTITDGTMTLALDEGVFEARAKADAAEAEAREAAQAAEGAQTDAGGALTRAAEAEAAAAQAAADLIDAQNAAAAAAADAQAAYDRAEAAETSAGSASASVTAAEAAAQASADDAAAALLQAQAAGTNATAAQTAADAAQASADTAAAEAATAGTAAAAADAAAAQAAADAAQAVADAAAAAQSAQQAATDAGSAAASASVAQTAADDAAADLVIAQQQAANAAASASAAATDAEEARARADAALAAASNVIPDPSLERQSRTLPAGFVYSTTEHRTGAVALQANASTGSRSLLLAEQIPVLPGETWRAVAWVKTTADYNGTSSWGKLRIGSGAANGIFRTAMTFPVSSAGWTEVVLDYTVPTDGTVADLGLQVGADHTVGTLWVDDLAFRNVTAALALDAKADAAEADAAQAAADAAAAASSASTAEQRATTAEAEAAAAQAAAGTAESNAAAALSSASTAEQAATSAQSSASAAASDASTAVSTANAAASDASAAVGTANAAASDASAAVGTANAAASDASTALSTANARPLILFGTGGPVGTAPQGSTWFRVDGSGSVIGQWQQTAAGNAGSTWSVRQIRSEVIANLDVGKLVAGTASLDEAVANKIRAAVLIADAVTADHIDTTGLVSEGVRVVEDLDGVEIVRVNLSGTGSQRVEVYGDDGEVASSLSHEGGVVGARLVANEEIILRGDNLSERLDAAPAGTVAASGAFPATMSTLNTEYGLTEVAWTIPERFDGVARMYRFAASNLLLRQWGQYSRVSLRVTTDGSQPSITSPLYAVGYTPRTDSGDNFSAHMTFFQSYAAAAGTKIRALLTVASESGGNIAWINAQNPKFIVDDVGPELALGGIVNSGGGSRPGSSPTPPPTEDPVQPYLLEWDRSHGSSWWETWENGGTGGATAATYVIQGSWGSYTWESRWGWGTAIQSALSGSSAKDVYVRLKCLQAGTGVVRARVGTNTSTSAASGRTGITVRAEVDFAPGEEKWVRLGGADVAEAFRTGALSGFGILSSAAYANHYGRFDPSRLAVRINFEK